MEISRRVYKISNSPAILQKSRLVTIDIRDTKEKWEALEVGWFKLNFDGVCHSGGFQTIYGGVLRNYVGEWINGYSIQIDSTVFWKQS